MTLEAKWHGFHQTSFYKTPLGQLHCRDLGKQAPPQEGAEMGTSVWDRIHFCGHTLDCISISRDVCYGRILDFLGVSSASAPHLPRTQILVDF